MINLTKITIRAEQQVPGSKTVLVQDAVVNRELFSDQEILTTVAECMEKIAFRTRETLKQRGVVVDEDGEVLGELRCRCCGQKVDDSEAHVADGKWTCEWMKDKP